MKAFVFGAVALTMVSTQGEVRLFGPGGKRLDQMIENHVKATDIDSISSVFLSKNERHGWWQAEFWGKYMHSAVPFREYTGDAALAARIDKGLDNVLASQEPCGYIGNYPEELRCNEGWDVWGMKYTMMGLMHYYDGANGSERGKKALDAAKKVCDYVISMIGTNGKRGVPLYKTGYWAGYASSSILEPVIWLYKRTNEKRYLDFATYIVKGMTEPEDGPRLVFLAGTPVADRNGFGIKPDPKWGYVSKINRLKAYEMMSCYQGLIEYYEVTGRKDLLEAAEKTAANIMSEEINIAGGSSSSEAWYHGAPKQHLPYTHMQETCVTTTWMRFAGKLLAITGDPKYADELEKVFYNAYLASLNADATEFAAYTTLNGTRSRGHHHCFMHTNCCNANGPRGFLEFLRGIITAKDQKAVMNFYTSGLEKVKLPATGEEVAFYVYTLYPKEGFVRIVNRTEKQGKFTLSLRIPAWSAKTTVAVNGKAQGAVKAGAYFDIDRDWAVGDVVELKLDMSVRVTELNKHVAFVRGPVVLARDTRYGDGPIDAVFYGVPKGDEFALVKSPSEEFVMTVEANLPLDQHHENPEGRLYTAVKFCDYASAANRWQPDNACRVWFILEHHPWD